MFKYRLDPLLNQKAQVKQRQAELLSTKERVRNELLSPGGVKPLTGEEVRRRLDHLRGVDQDVESARGEVFAQKQAVDESQERLIQARQYLAECAREVEVLEKHRDKAEAHHEKQLERKEAHELDEVAGRLFISRRKLT